MNRLHKKGVILLFFLLLFSISVYGKPQSPVKTFISTNNTDVKNEVIVGFIVKTLIPLANVTVQMMLPTGTEAVGPNIAWRGDIPLGDNTIVSYRVRVLERGNYTVKVVMNSSKIMGGVKYNYSTPTVFYLSFDNETIRSFSYMPPKVDTTPRGVTVGTSINPGWITFSLSILETPKVNQTVELVSTIKPTNNPGNFTLSIGLPEGVELISGNTTWEGNIDKDETKEIRLKLRLIKVGIWNLSAQLSCKDRMHPSVNWAHTQIIVPDPTNATMIGYIPPAPTPNDQVVTTVMENNPATTPPKPPTESRRWQYREEPPSVVYLNHTLPKVGYFVELSPNLSGTPILNQTVEVVSTIKVTDYSNNFTLNISLPEGIEFVDENTSWSGHIGENETKIIKTKIKVVKAGQWNIPIELSSPNGEHIDRSSTHIEIRFINDTEPRVTIWGVARNLYIIPWEEGIIRTSLSFEGEPKLNENIWLTSETIRLSPDSDSLPYCHVYIFLYEGLVLVDGNLTWDGPLKEGETKEIKVLVKPFELGNWTIASHAALSDKIDVFQSGTIKEIIAVLRGSVKETEEPNISLNSSGKNNVSTPERIDNGSLILVSLLLLVSFIVLVRPRVSKPMKKSGGGLRGLN